MPYYFIYMESKKTQKSTWWQREIGGSLELRLEKDTLQEGLRALSEGGLNALYVYF
jgi:hypothetical protein